MKNIAKILILFFLFLNLFALASDNLKVMRDLMVSATNNKSVSDVFYDKVKGYTNSSPALYIGYKAIGELLQCKHSINPFTKWSYFSSGKKNLELAISKEPNNIELLFFRFTTQVNTPSFLSYKNNIEEDKKKLIKYVKENKTNKSVDSDLYIKIKGYLQVSPNCTQTEKSEIK